MSSLQGNRLFHTLSRWVMLGLQALRSRQGIAQGTAICWPAPRQAALETVVKLMPGPHEVLILTEFTAVSPGTERAYFTCLPNTPRKFPQYPGYSGVGHIIAVGPQVSFYKVGDRVGGCFSHSSILKLDASNVFAVPREVDLMQASFIQIGIIALQGFRKARIKLGERVTVLGQGLLGQLITQIAVGCGAFPVTAITRTPARATFSRFSGADRVLNLESGDESLKDVNADVTFEVTGNPDALQYAIRCTRIGGRIVLLGSNRGVTKHLDLHHIIRERNLTLIGAHVGTLPQKDSSDGLWTAERERKTFLRFLQSGIVQLDGLITDRVSPAESKRFYRRLSRSDERVVGAVFEWGRLPMKARCQPSFFLSLPTDSTTTDRALNISPSVPANRNAMSGFNSSKKNFKPFENIDSSLFRAWLKVLQTIKAIKIEPGELVAVIGQGQLGQMISQMLRLAGAGIIAEIDREISNKHDLYGDMFIELANKEWETNLCEMLTGEKFDCVIDISSSLLLIDHLLPFVRKNGRVLLLSESYGHNETFDFYSKVHRYSLSVIGLYDIEISESNITNPYSAMNSDIVFLRHLLETNKLCPIAPDTSKI